jgi:hypothetical protein
VIAVIPYILWLPNKGVGMLFCRLPSKSTLSIFLLKEILKNKISDFSQPLSVSILTSSNRSRRNGPLKQPARRDTTNRKLWCAPVLCRCRYIQFYAFRRRQSTTPHFAVKCPTSWAVALSEKRPILVVQCRLSWPIQFSANHGSNPTKIVF